MNYFKTEPDYYVGTNQELANELGDMRYDALAEFLGHLADKIREDGEKDASRGRPKLAKYLTTLALHLRVAQEGANAAWGVCEQYVDHDEEADPSLP